MNRFDSTKLRPQVNSTSEGWLVQVYGGDRRLLCVLEPSHGWTFLLGLGFGLCLAVGWANLTSDRPATSHAPPTIPAEMWVD